MNKTTKTIVIIAAVMIVAGMSLCVVAFSTADWNINKLYSLVNAYDDPQYKEQEYHIPAIGLTQLTVDTVSDNVIILPNTENEIRVVCRDTQYYTYRVETSGSTLHIDYYKPASWFGFINLIPRIAPANVEIWLPETFFTEGNIDVELISGDISMENIRGNILRAETVSGNIKMNSCQIGQISWNTVSGETVLTDCTGGVPQGKTTSGDIQIRDCAFDRMILHTVSGDIKATLLGESQDYRIETESISGDIQKDRGNAQAEQLIYLETVSGDIDLQFYPQ